MRVRVHCLLALLIASTATAQAPRSEVEALLDRGIARMGGDSLLRSVSAVRLDMLTQWSRITFAEAPFSDLPGYEHNVELRDYRTPAWRNTRYFSPTDDAIGVVDVVRDTVAVRRMARAANAEPTWGPLNVAYVQERRELFAFTPERLLLTLRDADNRRLLADTVLDGVPHARLAARIEDWESVTFLRRSDGLPRLVRFRADATDDFGLAPWAEHEVEFWYSNWSLVAPGVLLPRQRDVRRVGRPYKRMTVLRATINPVTADSFPVTDSLEAAYLATERRPMWQVPLEGTADAGLDGFAAVPPFTGSAGAVAIGGRWVVMETGQAPGAIALVARWLEEADDTVPIGAAFATNVWTGNGGVPWFTARGIPVHAAPGAMPILRRINGGERGIAGVDSPRWLRVGSDSLWVEPVSAPDFAGTLAVYSPTHRWLWLPFTGSPTHRPDQEAVIARLEARGLMVELLGGPRALRQAR